MNCYTHCPLGFSLLAIPVLRVVDAQTQQTGAQLPWWLWLIFVLLAIIAIFWWQVYLRPSQAHEVQELEHHIGHGHDNHIPAEVDSHRFHADINEPMHETSGKMLETNELAAKSEAETAMPGNEIEPEE